MVMTTHSPYVLTKINNLLKAGSLYRKLGESTQRRLQSIVPRQAALSARLVRAYALKSGEALSIIDAEGLINGEYLDEISDELSKEFSALLELEESIGT